MTLYRVFWKSTLTGASGALTGPVSRYLAEFRASHERVGSPHITLWVEPVAT